MMKSSSKVGEVRGVSLGVMEGNGITVDGVEGIEK